MFQKIKLKHIGFVIGIALLLIGWLTRLGAFLFIKETVLSADIDKVGTYIAGASVFFILGGILFYALIASKEEKDEPIQELTEEQQKQKVEVELENTSFKIKNSMAFTAVYGLMSMLLLLLSISILINNDQSFYFGLGGLIAGISLSQYYIRKFIRQIKWLKGYKKYTKQ